MRKLRQNRWVRIGILLSVIWSVGAAIHTHNDTMKSANFWVKLEQDSCIPATQASLGLESCEAKSAKTYKAWMEGDRENMAIVALAPVPFAWFGAFVLVYVVRAQIVGFRAVVPWATLMRPKKVLVGFCCLVSALFLMFGLVMAMNLYVDTKVPVGMASFQDVTKT